MSLFPEHRTAMDESAKLPAEEFRAVAHNLVVSGIRTIRAADNKELAAELREPTTDFADLRAATTNEALARMLEFCAL